MRPSSCYCGQITVFAPKSFLSRSARTHCTPRRWQRYSIRAHVQNASHTPPIQVTEQKTYLGESYHQVRPSHSTTGLFLRDQPLEGAPEVKLSNLNHASLEAVDVHALADFYVKVLSFQKLDRPNFPFDGAWLQGGNLTLHIIEEDPSVPKHVHHWQEKYKQEPQTWYIRRANHLAFEVDDASAMEKRLQYFGIEYTRAIVPDTEAVQLFFFDPHGNGVEVGSNYGEVAEMLERRKATNGTAVSP